MIDFIPDEGCVWIFQCNVEKYVIEQALLNPKVLNCLHWKVKQHKHEIKKGDVGLIWCSGTKAGIYAITEMISDPGLFKEEDYEKEYWKDDSDEEGLQFRVQMKVIKNMSKHPIKKEEIRNTNGLQNLSIIKMPRGTNFSVTDEEWSKLIRMLS